jgi:hypothetical protein
MTVNERIDQHIDQLPFSQKAGEQFVCNGYEKLGELERPLTKKYVMLIFSPLIFDHFYSI